MNWQEKTILIAVCFTAYLFIFLALVPFVKSDKLTIEDAHSKCDYSLYYNNGTWQCIRIENEANVKPESGVIRATQHLSIEGKATYKLKRSTAWGYIETDNNHFPYFFDTVLLPKEVFGFNFHYVHVWFFRFILLSILISTGTEVLKWKRESSSRV